MKKTAIICSLLFLPALLQARTAPEAQQASLDWSVQKTWKLESKPLDIAQSLDNKKVFVLGDDCKVYIYNAQNGRKLGVIPVDKGTSAIDIAPRGEMLYLIGENSTYTAIDVSFTQQIDISGAPFLGNEKAPVTLIVFSDFQ